MEKGLWHYARWMCINIFAMCVDKLYLCLLIVSECGPPFFLVVEALVAAAFWHSTVALLVTGCFLLPQL
jgi:hypothetical protein